MPLLDTCSTRIVKSVPSLDTVRIEGPSCP